MKKLLTTVFCLSMLAFCSQGAFAKGFSFGTQKSPQINKAQKHQHTNLDEYLNLTETQKAQVKANRENSRKQMKPIMEQMQTKRKAMFDVMKSDLPKEQKEAKIKPIKEEMKSLHQKANTIRQQNMKDFENILTAEQKTKFQQFKNEHKPSKGHSVPKGKFNK